MPRKIAYLRISTIDQNLEKNKADILHLANEKSLGRVEFVEEKISGKGSWRKRKIGVEVEYNGDYNKISRFTSFQESTY